MLWNLPEMWRIVGLTGLWFISTELAAQPGKRIQGNVPASSARVFAYSGTQGYLFSAKDLVIGRGARGQLSMSFREGTDYPFEPLGTAFLVAPDLLLSAGNIIKASTPGGLFWIPVRFLERQVPDSVVFPVAAIQALSYTGIRGSDENFALLQLARSSGLPPFNVDFSPLKAIQPLRCCMDDGTLESVHIEADEGTRSLFVSEQFPGACTGSAVLNEQGLVVGILIPGPHAGTMERSGQDLQLYGNAVQRLSTLPVQVLFLVMEAKVKQALRAGDYRALKLWLPYLKLFCGSGSEVMFEAAKAEHSFLLDSLLSMSCTQTCLNLNQRDENGATLLHVLLQRKNVAALNRLFACPGLSVNAQDGNGRTPLHQAVYATDLAQVELLLKHGANVHIRDQKGETCLFEAVRSGNLSICRVLLAHSAWDDLSGVEKKQMKNLVKATEDKKLSHLFKKYR